MSRLLSSFGLVLSLTMVLISCQPVTLEEEAEPPTCEEYCDTITLACTDDFQQFNNTQACNTYCSDLAQLPKGFIDDTKDNTVACRLYHAKIANTSKPEVHCPHAGPTGDHTCGSLCENYCHLVKTNCSALIKEDKCLSLCEKELNTNQRNQGSANDDDGDSIQCRMTYLIRAGGEAQQRQENCENGRIASPECQ